MDPLLIQNKLYLRIAIRIIFVVIFAGIVAAVIAYARGYRIDLNQRSLKSTGIISVSSNPKAAKIYVNNELKGVTDTNVILPPGSYQIDIKKDGYTSWTKKINLKGELVMTVDALLFPQNPSLSPLTNLGVTQAIPLDQTDRILLFVENTATTESVSKDGIYLFEANKKPINIFSPLKLILAKQILPPDLNFVPNHVIFSPDFKQGIFEYSSTTTKNTSAFLFSLDEENTTLFDITTSKNTLTDAWDKERIKNHMKMLETYPKEIIKIASDSFRIISFSPNETKVLYQAITSLELPPGITPPVIATNQTPETRFIQKNHYYIYDKKEDKNYDISESVPDMSKYDENQPTVDWYYDSKRLILNEQKRIAIMDYDGLNKQTIYSAPFENIFITAISDGNLIILSNLNPEANKYPDLYVVGIK